MNEERKNQYPLTLYFLCHTSSLTKKTDCSKDNNIQKTQDQTAYAELDHKNVSLVRSGIKPKD